SLPTLPDPAIRDSPQRPSSALQLPSRSRGARRRDENAEICATRTAVPSPSLSCATPRAFPSLRACDVGRNHWPGITSRSGPTERFSGKQNREPLLFLLTTFRGSSGTRSSLRLKFV